MKKACTLLMVFALAMGVLPAPARALWQDEAGKMKLIGKVKAQGSWRTEDSPPITPVPIEAGDMTSQRDLLMLDFKHDVGEVWQGAQFEYYLQGKAFYDTVWNYGPKVFSDDDTRAQYCLDNRDQINDEKKKLELYYAFADLTWGSFFARVGRQTISWGEMTTIRVLDGANPMNNSSMAVDMLERRIPIWMVRANKVFDNIGPFDSLSLEGYYNPGKIDNTYEEEMIDGSPIVPTIGRDEVEDYANPFSMASLKRVINQERSDIDEDRYGIKLGATLMGFDMSLAYFRMYSEMPVPWVNSASLQPITAQIDKLDMNDPLGSILNGQKIEVDLTRDTVDVFGGSFSTSVSAINAVVRGETAYYLDVPKISPGGVMGLIDELAPKVTLTQFGQPKSIQELLALFPMGNINSMVLPFSTGAIKKMDVWKYGIAIDKFKKIPFISNDDIMFTFEYVGSKNMDYQRHTIMFPWSAPWDDNQDGHYDVCWEPEYSNTFILLLRASYLNGNLIPQIVSMLECETEALVLIPSLTYTWRNLQFQAQYFFTKSSNYDGYMGMLDKSDEVTLSVTYNF